MSVLTISRAVLHTATEVAPLQVPRCPAVRTLRSFLKARDPCLQYRYLMRKACDVLLVPFFRNDLVICCGRSWRCVLVSWRGVRCLVCVTLQPLPLSIYPFYLSLSLSLSLSLFLSLPLAHSILPPSLSLFLSFSLSHSLTLILTQKRNKNTKS